MPENTQDIVFISQAEKSGEIISPPYIRLTI